MPPNGTGSAASLPPRGMSRGRGVFIPRGGRGAGVNGSSVPSGGHVPPPGGEVKTIPPSTGYMGRGGSHYTPRGRGTYPNTTRQLTSTSQPSLSGSSMPTSTIKRGPVTGPPGPKRGRYDSGPHTGTRPIPQHHGSSQVSSHPPPHMNSYNSAPVPQSR